MQLQVSLFAFVVCVSLISAGKHYSHQGECNHRPYDDDNDLDAIPAGGYEIHNTNNNNGPSNPISSSYNSRLSSNPLSSNPLSSNPLSNRHSTNRFSSNYRSPNQYSSPQSTNTQIHRQNQQTHHSLFQQDTPFLKTGVKSIRKPFYKTNTAYGYGEPQRNNQQIVPFKNSKGYKESENDANNEKFSSSSTYSNLWHYLLKSNLKMKLRKKPWLLLPNHGSCYQEYCKSEKDCCRHYNICDKSAQVCIDCWYGYPCSTSADCCERYPVCHRSYGEEHGRCSKK